jgi:hypothetical protein
VFCLIHTHDAVTHTPYLPRTLIKQTALAVVGGVVGGAALLWPVGIWWEVGKCEKPKYEVLRALAR